MASVKFAADFHLHSKYSRATSKDLDLENLDKWARIKGVKVLGTGDFTHPEWFKNLKEKLKPAAPGLFALGYNPQPGSGDPTFFILTVEISCIYSKNGRVRKIHVIIVSPSFEICEKINSRLSFIGNLKADGRPILGLDAKELAKIVLNISSDCLVIPAHAWTPWFSVFGSRSGFDSIEECFEEYSQYIYAIETGLSSDPAMNWRLSALDKVALISCSDAHSPAKIGREANIFNTEIDYFAIAEAIKSKSKEKFLHTVEFFPEEGKYHYDGHRLCGISLPPEETKKLNNLCPKCGRILTIGVLNRVNVLADRAEGFRPDNAIPFKSLVPLEEIIANVLGVGVGAKQVRAEYENLIKKIGNEFHILLSATEDNLQSITFPEIVEGILKVREGKVEIAPGYDGVYGKIKVFSREDQKVSLSQKSLFI